MLVLNGFHHAPGAEYQHGNRRCCLKGTAESELSDIEHWIGGFNRSPVFWLNGLMGMGKSTIAQTIAGRIYADGQLGGSFFCSRSIEGHSNLQLIFPTLAFQLALKYPAFCSSFIPILQSNPDILHKSLQEQFQKFLVGPLQSANISTVIVIDAINECRGKDPESAILLVLGQSVAEIPGVRFFITSQPGRDVMPVLYSPPLKNAWITHHNIKPDSVDKNIHHFFKHELSRLADQNGGMEGWPADEQLNSLCQKAAGIFVYAAMTVNFLNHYPQDLLDQLNTIMESPGSVTHNKDAKLEVYNSLDSLYALILHTSFLGNDTDGNAIVRSILSAVVFVTNPLSLLGACYNLFLGVPRTIKDIPRSKQVTNRLCSCSPQELQLRD